MPDPFPGFPSMGAEVSVLLSFKHGPDADMGLHALSKNTSVAPHNPTKQVWPLISTRETPRA